ncbi:BCAM0308 family protein [Noviherbaspirillum sp.]|uniref:BCAM0308 family protein n=1 Tax=Noviherbaspirillum sp. TaxID=1926288 RepID=UPI002B49BAA6|nr:BCAM0308 family protein [Noviherbaspirillum sp.]HJV80679.1 BCAM0308 family protein [Noviherbaspirillum sp.]
MHSAQPPLSAFGPGRHLQALDEQHHDPYQNDEKLSGPAVCEKCAAVYESGRWQWALPPADAVAVRCPACRRIADRLAAGYISISGNFAREHQEEIINLIRHAEIREKTEHPMQRIMSFRAEDGRLLIETTDVHLARGIGEALERAYKGDLTFHYNEAAHLLRLHWQR